jgi:hypothetical protein
LDLSALSGFQGHILFRGLQIVIGRQVIVIHLEVPRAGANVLKHEGALLVGNPPQDLLVSDSCAEYMVRVARFIDDLLVKYYGLEPFYNVKKADDLIGHLVIGLAPHTSAGVLARIVGFTRANVGYAHPFFHFPTLQS